MEVKSILTPNQKKILMALSGEKLISENFYLTGGTALSEFYLLHRYSEDLDFFCEAEFEPEVIFTVLKKIGKNTSIQKVDYQQSFNRNLYFLHLPNEIIKTEFTYFPFPRIEKNRAQKELMVDSLIDIAVNKLFTIYQKVRARDFIDLDIIMSPRQVFSKS